MHHVLHSSLHVDVSPANHIHRLLPGRLDLFVAAIPAHIQVFHHIHIKALTSVLHLLRRCVPNGRFARRTYPSIPIKRQVRERVMDTAVIMVSVTEPGTGGTLLADAYRVLSPAIKLIPAFLLLLVDEWHLRLDQVVLAYLMLILLLCFIDEHLNEVSTMLLISRSSFRRSVGLFPVHELV